MLGKTMLTTMFDYNAAMNARILDCAAKIADEHLDAPTGYSQGSLRMTLWHLLIVEYGWRNQTQGLDVRKDPFPVEQTAPIAAMQAFQQREADTVRALLRDLSEVDLGENLTLKRWNGSTATLARWQIFTHILYHSAQHRSEAAELLTRAGQSPGDTDFLFYALAPPAN